MFDHVDSPDDVYHEWAVENTFLRDELVKVDELVFWDLPNGDVVDRNGLLRIVRICPLGLEQRALL